MKIETIINGKKMILETSFNEYLADTLRRYGILSIRKGCDSVSCGLCTIWLDGKPVPSCSVLTVRATNKEITTIEGVQADAKELAVFLVAQGAEQCGFCSPGFIMTVLALKKEIPNPSEDDIIHYLTGNLCRCTGYVGQLRAIKKYLGVQ